MRGSSRTLPALHSRWQDAVNDAGRLPAAKLLPLMKLSLAENLQLEREKERSTVREARNGAASCKAGIPGTFDASQLL